MNALIEMRSGAPVHGSRRPPRAGPMIPARFICTPPSVIAEGSSSASTMSGIMAPITGAAKAIPMPSAKMQTSTEIELITPVQAPIARSAEQAPCQRTAVTITARRFTRSAMAPAGSLNMKNGTAAAVAMKESSNAEAPRSGINQVAAISWAATKVPDRTFAHQSRQNAGFRSANHVEVGCAFIVRRSNCAQVSEPCSSLSVAGGRGWYDQVPLRATHAERVRRLSGPQRSILIQGAS
jgi:hypothetical protein